MISAWPGSHQATVEFVVNDYSFLIFNSRAGNTFYSGFSMHWKGAIVLLCARPGV